MPKVLQFKRPAREIARQAIAQHRNTKPAPRAKFDAAAAVAKWRASKAVVVLLLLCSTSFAQEPKFKLDYGDAAYFVGSAVDVGVSINKYERNPLWRDERGVFTPGKNLAFKSALWGGLKWLEYKHPERKRTFMWTKIGIGAAFALVGVLSHRGSKGVR